MGNLDGLLVIFFDCTPSGGSGRNFDWKFWKGPGWENQKDFWLENVKVKHSVKRMEMWSGGPKEDVPWSKGRVWAW